MTYYVVFYRVRGAKDWMFADQHSIPHTYRSYPVLHEDREWADVFAVAFVNTGGAGYETRVVEVTITPPGD